MKVKSSIIIIPFISFFSVMVSAQDLSDENSSGDGMIEGLFVSVILISVALRMVYRSSDSGRLGKLKNMGFISKVIFWFVTWMLTWSWSSLFFDDFYTVGFIIFFSCFLPIIIFPTYIILISITSPIEKGISSAIFGTKALELSGDLEETINKNIILNNEKQILEQRLSHGSLTDDENIRLQKELLGMENSLEKNNEVMESMASELENLRSQISEQNQSNELSEPSTNVAMSYQDSVHQGDHVNQKVDSQTINDPDAIARIALESYKQAMKDMREKEW